MMEPSEDAMVIVKVKHGALRGITENTKNGCTFHTFLGIPYAKPPIDKLRFKAPQAAEPWEGILDCTIPGDPCYHHDLLMGGLDGSENCLNLNVYTSQLPQQQDVTVLRPVMVWIHGGGFVSGSNKRNTYGPEFLIDKEIVLVSINYRLGALGFLSLDDQILGVSGNAGLKDQVMALNWVQTNIVYFGGDNKNVTIFGESAGGASVGYHMVSPMSKGLFHKAILQSGVPNCLWAQGSTNAAQELMKLLGKQATSDADILHILQSLTMEELLDLQLQIPDPWKPSRARIFGPVIEKPNDYETIFLHDDPMKIIERFQDNKVPIMIGVTSQEGLLMSVIEDKMNVDFTPKSDEEFIPFTFNLTKGSPFSLQVGRKIREYYYGDDIPHSNNKRVLIEYMSDVYFNRPCIDFIETILKTNHEKLFAYRFCLNTELNIFRKVFNISVKVDGICHAEDLFYLFTNEVVDTSDMKENSAEDVAIRRMTRWWTNFAKYANPNGNNTKDPVLSIEWPEAKYCDIKYIDINQTLTKQNDFLSKVSEFWKFIENLV